MHKKVKLLARCGVGFGGHLGLCFAAAAATPIVAGIVGLAVTPMAGMVVGLGLATTVFAVCGGYKKPKESAGFVALGLAALLTHHTFFMAHEHTSTLQSILDASRCFTP